MWLFFILTVFEHQFTRVALKCNYFTHNLISWISIGISKFLLSIRSVGDFIDIQSFVRNSDFYGMLSFNPWKIMISHLASQRWRMWALSRPRRLWPTSEISTSLGKGNKKISWVTVFEFKIRSRNRNFKNGPATQFFWLDAAFETDFSLKTFFLRRISRSLQFDAWKLLSVN